MGNIIIGNRIPRDFFITSGYGQSDLAVHSGSYHLALKDAGIESYNIMTYSSILPSVAQRVEIPSHIVHGSVLESIMAVSTCSRNERATAGIIYGWLYDKQTNEKFGGLVCEYNCNDSEESVSKGLHASLDELYCNGFSDQFYLKDKEIIVRSIVPEKKYGTSLVAIGFTTYEVPVSES